MMIAKIERAEAIPVLQEILDASDGIMVARGDLAVEVGNAAVPALQKRMIRMARESNKLAITATQMMESMIVNAVPTRAEVSDVANAVLDGTDAVMTSAETASGKYPIETVEMMAAICAEAEQSEYNKLDADFLNVQFTRIDQSIAYGALFTAHHLRVKAIVALTESGSTALWMSRHSIDTPIFALTPSQHDAAQSFAVPQRASLPPAAGRRQPRGAAPGGRTADETGHRQQGRHDRRDLGLADGTGRRHQRTQDRARRRIRLTRMTSGDLSRRSTGRCTQIFLLFGVLPWPSYPCVNCWTMPPKTATACRHSTSTTSNRCRPSWLPPTRSIRPVIMQASAGARKYAGEAFLRHLIDAAVEAYPHIPVVMHQDHGQSPAVCMAAIRSGFTSVMMDGSLEADGKSVASLRIQRRRVA